MDLPRDFTFDSVGLFTSMPGFNTPDNAPVERLHRRFRALTAFLQDNCLVTRTILAEGRPVTDDIAITAADLTGEGLELMKKCHRKWLGKMDRGMPPDDVSMFKKELAKLRAARG